LVRENRPNDKCPDREKVPNYSKYDYIIVCTKSQLGWLNLPHLPILAPPVTARQRVVIIKDQSEQGINGYVGKDSEKRKVLRRQWKRHEIK